MVASVALLAAQVAAGYVSRPAEAPSVAEAAAAGPLPVLAASPAHRNTNSHHVLPYSIYHSTITPMSAYEIYLFVDCLIMTFLDL